MKRQGAEAKALECMYESIKSRFAGLTFDSFADQLRDWELRPVTDGGEVIGGVILKGAELHCGFSRRPRSTIRRQIRETLGELVKKYGCAVTLVASENAKGLRFCQRLGFRITGSNGAFIALKCEKVNYE